MRVLVLFSGEVELELVRERCAPILAGGDELALCYVLAPQADLSEAIPVQRKITSILRRVFDGAAENIAVFVATDTDGDRVVDWARAWGATDVRP
jgi:hypothetical protein